MNVVAIIEPPVVTEKSSTNGLYIISNGHFRIEALKETGEKTVTCLLSKGDEAFTYNKHINRPSIIQEHHMILKAVERDVVEEKIAKALGMKSIIEKRNLLEGICPEAVNLL